MELFAPIRIEALLKAFTERACKGLTVDRLQSRYCAHALVIVIFRSILRIGSELSERSNGRCGQF